MQVSDKSNFQIILEPDDGDIFSEYWQDQCKYFYDELFMALPEGSIKPLTLESSAREKTDITICFNFLIDLVAGVCAHKVFDILKDWYEYRQHASIKIKCPDGSVVEIPKQSITKLSNFSCENPNLSICEALNHFFSSTD